MQIPFARPSHILSPVHIRLIALPSATNKDLLDSINTQRKTSFCWGLTCVFIKNPFDEKENKKKCYPRLRRRSRRSQSKVTSRFTSSLTFEKIAAVRYPFLCSSVPPSNLTCLLACLLAVALLKVYIAWRYGLFFDLIYWCGIYVERAKQKNQEEPIHILCECDEITSNIFSMCIERFLLCMYTATENTRNSILCKSRFF